MFVEYARKMRYWSNEKLQKEDVFASVGPNSGDAEIAWRKAIDAEITRRK